MIETITTAVMAVIIAGSVLVAFGIAYIEMLRANKE
jgi:hypothetical protein